MLRSLLVASLAVVGVAGQSVSSKTTRNCSTNNDGRTLSCFTCMGRDLENCEYGLTCCRQSGACFKLVDHQHSLVVKGCTESAEEDASMKVRTLNVSLYWAANENIRGESFFCNGKPFCNSSPLKTALSSLLVMLVILVQS